MQPGILSRKPRFDLPARPSLREPAASSTALFAAYIELVAKAQGFVLHFDENFFKNFCLHSVQHCSVAASSQSIGVHKGEFVSLARKGKNDT